MHKLFRPISTYYNCKLLTIHQTVHSLHQYRLGKMSHSLINAGAHVTLPTSRAYAPTVPISLSSPAIVGRRILPARVRLSSGSRMKSCCKCNAVAFDFKGGKGYLKIEIFSSYFGVWSDYSSYNFDGFLSICSNVVLRFFNFLFCFQMLCNLSY